MDTLRLRSEDHTLWATVNRPDSRNAINFEVMEALEQVLDRLEGDESIRTFILSGSGDHFISGGDLKAFHTLKSADEARPMAERMHAILHRMEQLPCWTIAAVNGAAYGGGCEIMLAFDFRIAGPSAVFGFTQGKFYLPPGWGGLTRLVERVGRSTALKWLAEATLVTPGAALRHNLIDRLAGSGTLEEETWEWADLLSHNDRDFIANLKKGAGRLVKTRREAIRAEMDPFLTFWEHEKHEQRVERFLDRKSNQP